MLTRPLARTMSSVAKAPPRSCVRRFRSSRRARPVSSCCRSSITLPYCWTQVLRHGRLGEYHFLTQHRLLQCCDRRSSTRFSGFQRSARNRVDMNAIQRAIGCQSIRRYAAVGNVDRVLGCYIPPVPRSVDETSDIDAYSPSLSV